STDSNFLAGSQVVDNCGHGWKVVEMARSRRTKVPAADKTRLVLAVLAGEMTCAEAARRCGVTTVTMTRWKHQFLEAGAERLEEVPSGPAGRAGAPEQRRLRQENQELKLALAEATVQLRIWQRGAALIDQVPSKTSKP
ncbi:transposase, partial [Mycolicibacterium boenickei]